MYESLEKKDKIYTNQTK